MNIRTIFLIGVWTPFVLSRLCLAAPDSPTAPSAVAANNAWSAIQNSLPSAAHPFSQSITVDWNAVLLNVQAFEDKFPGDGNATAAQKLELLALIHVDDGKPNVSPSTTARVTTYLSDTNKPIRDRLEVTIAAAQATLLRTTFTSRAARLQAHEAHARDLIRNFPAEPEGYGYLLAQAKAEESVNARAIIQELISSNAPAAMKSDAVRVQARLDLEGKVFQLAGADSAIVGARGHVLVVYAWTREDIGYLPIVRRMALNPALRFIGINLDKTPPDNGLTSTLPGLQLREPGGMSGPLGKQLQLLTTPSVYLVDPQGFVQDVNAWVTAEDKATALAKGVHS